MDFTFLLCSERSGSNLITRLMDNHSQYCGPSPTHAMRIVLENAAGYGDLQDPGNWELLIEDIADLFQAKMGVWATRWTRSELLQITTPGDLSGLFRAFFEREARGHHKNRLFVKENHLYRQWDFIRRHFPEARFVWLVRDPRDMALSWKKSPNLRGCAIRSASIWQQDQSACLSLYHQLENRPFILKIHYEDLVADTPATLRKVCTFLDIPYESGMQSLEKNALGVANARRNPDWENTQKAVMKKNFNKYREGLSEEEIRYVEAVCHREMSELHYWPDFEIGEEAALREKIAPLELHEKPAYQKLPPEEREKRREWGAVVNRIRSRREVVHVG